MNRTTVENFILENFAGISQDYPWPDEPDYTVFRHNDNHKWFALIMTLPYATLAKQNPAQLTISDSSPENISIINLKADPDLIETLVQQPGILPAYHMNKTHWITILLDGTASREQIIQQIDMSYHLTAKPSRR